jgi:hypothetical protein
MVDKQLIVSLVVSCTFGKCSFQRVGIRYFFRGSISRLIINSEDQLSINRQFNMYNKKWFDIENRLFQIPTYTRI